MQMDSIDLESPCRLGFTFFFNLWKIYLCIEYYLLVWKQKKRGIVKKKKSKRDGCVEDDDHHRRQRELILNLVISFGEYEERESERD